jgi:hypothetical protein
MTKRKALLPIPPESVRCPFCDAGPGKHCKTSGGHKLRNAPGVRLSLIHVARIEKAATLDAMIP